MQLISKAEIDVYYKSVWFVSTTSFKRSYANWDIFGELPYVADAGKHFSAKFLLQGTVRSINA